MIPTEYTHCKMHYKLIKRYPEGFVLYAAGKAYELFKVYVAKKDRLAMGEVCCKAGDEYIYKGDSTFGLHAWGPPSLERADAIVRERTDRA